MDSIRSGVVRKKIGGGDFFGDSHGHELARVWRTAVPASALLHEPVLDICPFRVWIGR